MPEPESAHWGASNCSDAMYSALVIVGIMFLLWNLSCSCSSYFDNPGSFRTWSLLDSFSLLGSSKKKGSSAVIDPRKAPQGVTTETRDGQMTITTRRNGRSVTIPQSLPDKSDGVKVTYSLETQNLYQATNQTLLDLLEMSENLNSGVLEVNSHDLSSYNDRVKVFLALEAKLNKAIDEQSSAKQKEVVRQVLETVKNARHRILDLPESFTNDLPNPDAPYTEGMDYNDYMTDMAVSPLVKQQHNAYVNDKNLATPTPSFKPETSHSATVVPWVGLRRPQYTVNGKDLVDDSARSVPSSVDSSQLDRPVTLRWS